MLVYSSTVQPDCRSVVVSPCEADGDPAQSAPIEALATFQMRIRDTIDFTVDWTQWLAKNGAAILSNAVFSVAAASPSTPVISGQAFAPTGKCVVVLTAGVSPQPGDAYYLDLTVSVAATTPGPGDVVIPTRTLVRRIHVVLVNG